MNQNTLPTERFAIVGNIDPDAYTAATYKTAFVEVSKFRRFCAIIQAGDLGSSATLDAVLQRATDAAGTSAENITGTAITQLTQAGTDSNKQVVINYDTQNEQGNAKRFIGLSITIGTATSDAAAILLGFDAFFNPASLNDATSVDEIVSV